MLRLGEGDVAAFDRLHERYGGRVYSQLYSLIRDHHLAEDLCQEVFLRVYSYRLTYVPSARFSTWFFCIARRVGLNALRDRRRLRRRMTCACDLREPAARALERHTCCPRGTPEQCLFRQERRARVYAALQRLPERQRSAVVLQQFEQFDYRQIGRRLEVTTTAVQALLRRARRHLRRSLAGDAVAN
jgi:RNA polymerase sigma-70 factor (ECF subfamily)